jgi:hypothetical protein
MKTARDLLVEVAGLPSGHTSNCQDFTEIRLLPAIEARDAEWRRLVEEAQGERDKANALLLASAATKDAEHNTSVNMVLMTEHDRLKGELVEARRFIARVAKMGREVIQPTRIELHAIELADRYQPNCGRCLDRARCNRIGTCADRDEGPGEDAAPPAEHPYPGHCLECSTMQIPQGMATAPPAEQAQPTESRWCHVAPACISLVDHAPNMRCPGAAGQAQGEGALTLEMLDEVLRDHINDEYDRSTELAKRVKALMEMVADQAEALRLHTHLTKDGSATYSPAPPPPEAAGPKCEKPILSLNAPCTKQRNHGGDCEHDTRKAAGPGHAFVPWKFGSALCGHQTTHTAVCGKFERDHAVPPIPEGT